MTLETLTKMAAPAVTVTFDDCPDLDPVSQQMLRATALISALARSLASLGFSRDAALALVTRSLGHVWNEAEAAEGVPPMPGARV